jgi:hypothetical protein
MDPVILRDPEAARQFLLQGLWFQRAMHPGVATVPHALEWSLAIADAGQPLPPVGFVADLGHVALGKDREGRAHKESVTLPGVPPGLIRTYEDHVLGKIYADWTFERASDALRRLALGDAERAEHGKPLSEEEQRRRLERKRSLGLAYLVRQLRERGGFNGVEMSPGVIRGLLDRGAGGNKPEELLRQGWESLSQHGPLPLLVEFYEQIIAAARRMAEALAPEDVIALEQGTALLSMGEYVAHRQVLQIARRLEEGLPRHKVKPLHGRQEVPTRVLDEDTYPVGGFASISTRGSIESLLHSQLAFMEKEPEQRPDLFDMKYLRDELYYYSRDENQFLRRRRSFLFVLRPDLVQARFKDPDLPGQRLVLLLSLLLAAERRLAEWLSTDALRFEFLFVQGGQARPLEEEAKLLTLLFREAIETGTVGVGHVPAEELASRVKHHARRSLCQCLVAGVKPCADELPSDEAVVSELSLDGPRPELRIGRDPPLTPEGEEPFETWAGALLKLLQLWI